MPAPRFKSGGERHGAPTEPPLISGTARTGESGASDRQRILRRCRISRRIDRKVGHREIASAGRRREDRFDETANAGGRRGFDANHTIARGTSNSPPTQTTVKPRLNTNPSHAYLSAPMPGLLNPLMIV